MYTWPRVYEDSSTILFEDKTDNSEDNYTKKIESKNY